MKKAKNPFQLFLRHFKINCQLTFVYIPSFYLLKSFKKSLVFSCLPFIKKTRELIFLLYVALYKIKIFFYDKTP